MITRIAISAARAFSIFQIASGQRRSFIFQFPDLLQVCLKPQQFECLSLFQQRIASRFTQRMITTVLARLQRELEELKEEKADFIDYIGPDPKADDPFTWIAIVKGPPNSPFEGGKFTLLFEMSEEYPVRPPMKVELLTPIYHPNIQNTGGKMGSKGSILCLDIIDPNQYAWLPSMSIHYITWCFYTMLMEPNPNQPIDREIAKEMLRDKRKWFSKARLVTKEHAM